MKSPLPHYSLYGEDGQSAAVEWLHCESIAERSRLHDWEIRPHSHQLLFQLFWIEQGRCALSLDAVPLQVRGPCVLVLPPLSVHGFRFEPDVQGQVVTIHAQHVRQSLQREPRLAQRLARACAQQLTSAQADAIAAAVATLREEFLGRADWRALGVDSAMTRLLAVLGRCLADAEPPPDPQIRRALRHVERYRALVERNYRQQPTLGACAAEIGITTTQLNRVCQQVLGCTSITVLHARLVLEAQRELAYTTMSIKQIAAGLGFADAAYFTRFYQRNTGLTPTAWRRQAGQGI